MQSLPASLSANFKKNHRAAMPGESKAMKVLLLKNMQLHLSKK
jgi:hypothetical protein